MPERALCPICSKRRPERFCPAKGEKICAVCCGTEREVTLDCPADCAYLIKAHRYELQHRDPPTEDQIPFAKVEFSQKFIYERQPVAVGLCRTIQQFAAERRELTDNDALAALMALAETYRTLASGIYYEKPPNSLSAGQLYIVLEAFLLGVKQPETDVLSGVAPIKDEEIFHLLVFVARLAASHTNQRPRARIFLEFLRVQLPPEEAARAAAEAPRIIIP